MSALKITVAALTVSVTIFIAAADTSGPVFKDVTEARKIHFAHVSPHTSRKYLIESMGSGVAMLDYDNDGRLDIFLVNGAALSDPMPKAAMPQKTGPADWNRLYHQKADGTFEDVTETAGLAGTGFGMGVAVGDYDNDGNEDIYVTAYGGNRLYHNNGNGTFTDVTQVAGVGASGWSTSAAWVDLDNDGLLDLVVLRYVEWDFSDIYCGEHREGFRAYCHPDTFPAVPPLVFHNDGHGHFTEVSKQIGLAKPAKALGVSIADYDRDGHIDLFIANDSMVEYLYHNKGNGTFEETGLLAQVAVDEDGQTYAGMGTDFADYDNDGFPDIIVDNLANQKYALYRNNGDGTFNYVSQPTGLSKATAMHSGWGLRFLDFDNDGWKDLLFAQGHDLDTIEKTSPQLHYLEPPLLLRNIAAANRRNFDDISANAGPVFQERWAARGLATGDFDNDGRIDAIITTNTGAPHLLHNETNSKNHWLAVKLIGHKSNRDAIGAVVSVTTPLGTQYATVTTASSYLSASDKRLLFGLGQQAEIRHISILWPSGIKQRLEGVVADKLLTVDEPTEKKQ